MVDFLDCDLKGLGLEAILALLIESDGAGGAQLKVNCERLAVGGLSMYTNLNDSDFIATPTATTNNVVVTGLGFTLDEPNIAVGAAYRGVLNDWVPMNVDDLNVVVAAGVATVTFANEAVFAVGEQVIMLIVGATKAYDIDLDVLKTSDQTPDYGHYTESEHLVDFDSQGADTSRYIIPAESYTVLSLHAKIVNTNGGDTITVTFWATNNPDADASADTDWVDISNTLFGAANITVNNASLEGIYFLDTPMIPLAYMVKVVTATGGTNTNAGDVYIKKAYS